MGNRRPPLRSKDVAHILEMSLHDVIELARSGERKASKEGRFWRFREADVMAYLRKQHRERTQPAICQSFRLPPTIVIISLPPDKGYVILKVTLSKLEERQDAAPK